MAEVWFSEQADLALRTLEADPTQQRLLAEINEILALLESNPRDRRVRQRRYTNQAWRIDLRSADWMLLWLHDDSEHRSSSTLASPSECRSNQGGLRVASPSAVRQSVSSSR